MCCTPSKGSRFLRFRSNTMKTQRTGSAIRRPAICVGLICILVILSGFRSQPGLFFDEDERLWLEDHRTIRVGVFPWFPPVIFENRDDEGHPITGLAPDYLRRVGDIHKLPFEIIPFASKNEAWRALMADEIDLIPALESSPSMRAEALFTSPYVKLPSVIIARNDSKGLLTEADLLATGVKVGIVVDSPAHSYLALRYPDLPLETVSTVKDGLYMVSAGKIDAFIVDLAEAGHHLSELAVGNLHIAGETEHSLRISMATQQGDVELRNVIDRAIETLRPETRSQIQNRWIVLAGEQGVPWKTVLVGAIVAILVLVVIAGVIGSILLRRKVQLRTRELNATVIECKSAQEQLQKAFADAQNLTHKLQEGNLALLELSEQKSEFLGILSHDLKSPLNAILQTIQLYSSSDNPLPPELEESFAQIESIACGAITTIEEMITIDALDGNQLAVRPERQDIASLVREVIQSLAPQSKAKSISIITSTPDALETEFDYNLMFMALENVIGNALKFSPPERSVWVTLTRLEKANLTRIDVKDEGPGLTDNDKKRLFSKFARLSARPTAGESSTGLGLAITRKIIELHGGAIRANNCEKRGAVFTIEF